MPSVALWPPQVLVVLKPVNWGVSMRDSQGTPLLSADFLDMLRPGPTSPLARGRRAIYITRLDVPCSGLVLAAVTDAALVHLAGEMQVYCIDRCYSVMGQLAAAAAPLAPAAIGRR